MLELHVVYSSDNHYAQHVGTSMVSLFKNNKGATNINVYVIESNLSLNNKQKLKKISTEYNRQIFFFEFENFSSRLQLNINNSISINSYARLFISSMMNKSVDKVIYLDCDSIVNGSLKDLWETNITNYYVAGVKDTVSSATKLKINMEADGDYINAGMLLVNLKKWREDKIEEKFIEFINNYNGQVFHHDQGTINGVLKGKMYLLHPKYNAMSTYFTMNRDEIIKYYGLSDYYSDAELREAVSNPTFIHFTPAFVNRPWIRGCKHPLAHLYREYLEITPWKGISLGEDNRPKGEKFVAFLYNTFPFSIANNICNLIFR